MANEFLRQGQFARECGVAETTVKRWIRTGRIEFVELPGGERRIPRDELDRVLTRRRIEVTS